MSEKPMSELSADARAIISSGVGGDGPTANDRERVRASVLAAIAAGGAATAASTTAAATSSAATASAKATSAVATSSGIGLAAKLTIITAIAVGGGTGAYLASSANDSSSSSSSSNSNNGAVVSPAEHGALNVAPTQRPALDEVPASVSPTADPPRAVSEEKIEPARTTPRTKSESKPRSNDLAQLEMEQELLNLANEALRSGKPSRALDIIKESASLYPQPKLRQERSAIRVLALCSLGAGTEATSALESFRRRYESSPYNARIDRACADLP